MMKTIARKMASEALALAASLELALVLGFWVEQDQERRRQAAVSH